MRIILNPVTIAKCLEHTTPAEDAELEALVASATDELDACAKTSEWLLKRFPQLDVSIRRSMKAGTN